MSSESVQGLSTTAIEVVFAVHGAQDGIRPQLRNLPGCSANATGYWRAQPAGTGMPIAVNMLMSSRFIRSLLMASALHTSQHNYMPSIPTVPVQKP